MSAATRRRCVLGGGLIIGDVFDDVFHLAVQDLAENVDRFCADGFPVLHSMKRVGGNALFEDQIVFRESFFIERFIKGLIRNQIASPISF